jgi:hypothetical protein
MHPSHHVEFFDASFHTGSEQLCGACELRAQFVLKDGKRNAT